MKLSPFFNNKTLPIRKGIYQIHCDCCDGEYYSYWNGKYFCLVKDVLKGKFDKNTKDDLLILRKWRGILK